MNRRKGIIGALGVLIAPYVARAQGWSESSGIGIAYGTTRQTTLLQFDLNAYGATPVLRVVCDGREVTLTAKDFMDALEVK